MYMATARFGAARKSYQNVDLSSRIEGADPHGLVQILFEELMKAIEAMAAAARARDFSQRGTRQARALSILHGLEGSLDFDQGGDIAHSLAAIYREARRLVLEAGRSNDTAPLDRAREMLGEISGAWAALR
jgi:flagellar protein FliS